MFDPIFQQDIYIPVFINAGNHSDSTVYPTTLVIIIDKDHLCLFLDRQIQLRRQRGFREIPLYTSGRDKFITGQLRQSFFIDEIDLIATGGKRNVHVLIIRRKFREVTGI